MRNYNNAVSKLLSKLGIGESSKLENMFRWILIPIHNTQASSPLKILAAKNDDWIRELSWKLEQFSSLSFLFCNLLINFSSSTFVLREIFYSLLNIILLQSSTDQTRYFLAYHNLVCLCHNVSLSLASALQ